jgi:hypothetical protein
MVIEKSRERVPIWKSFATREAEIPVLFSRVVKLGTEEGLSLVERALLVQFLISAFEAMEYAAVRQVGGRAGGTNRVQSHPAAALTPPPPPPCPEVPGWLVGGGACRAGEGGWGGGGSWVVAASARGVGLHLC